MDLCLYIKFFSRRAMYKHPIYYETLMEGHVCDQGPMVIKWSGRYDSQI